LEPYAYAGISGDLEQSKLFSLGKRIVLRLGLSIDCLPKIIAEMRK